MEELKSGAKLVNFCGFQMRIRGNLGFVLFEMVWLIFGAERFGIFSKYGPAFRYNLFVSSLGTRQKGFPLQSGLKGEILLFYHHPKRNMNDIQAVIPRNTYIQYCHPEVRGISAKNAVIEVKKESLCRIKLWRSFLRQDDKIERK